MTVVQRVRDTILQCFKLCRVLLQEVPGEDLTAVTPQVKPLMMKTDATQTQPYPPSGGESAAEFTSFDGTAIARFSSIFGVGGLLTIPADIFVFQRDENSSTRARFATMIKRQAANDAAAADTHVETLGPILRPMS